ncbi:MAG: acyl-CoA thioesterase [Thermanaerothrix sp.]|jgi:acyl-CoA thioester hydrolase|uniref:Thioesterase family protein n=1 Tax=Thermanaerothrix solaris TaxID=3058434 RepID=A0ABU3NQU2_9CHLR|nr:thioesterase family protein [Thermanaerothrix sp. 4228-RoL]MDT8899205.1 thioesterase family protein [Thermanaerothrix sp. 4228-RoL]
MNVDFRFYYPIQVRYGDLDPQWHVNNARFLTYLEQARLAYLIHLGLFDGHSFLDLGLIVADIHIAYRAPIALMEELRVGVKTVHLGNKSLKMVYVIENPATGQIKAQAEVVMVAYDYHSQTSIPLSRHWRETIAAFEGIPAYAEG